MEADLKDDKCHPRIFLRASLVFLGFWWKCQRSSGPMLDLKIDWVLCIKLWSSHRALSDNCLISRRVFTQTLPQEVDCWWPGARCLTFSWCEKCAGFEQTHKIFHLSRKIYQNFKVRNHVEAVILLFCNETIHSWNIIFEKLNVARIYSLPYDSRVTSFLRPQNLRILCFAL